MNREMTKKANPCLKVKNMMSAATALPMAKIKPPLRAPNLEMMMGASIIPGVKPTEVIV